MAGSLLVIPLRSRPLSMILQQGLEAPAHFSLDHHLPFQSFYIALVRLRCNSVAYRRFLLLLTRYVHLLMCNQSALILKSASRYRCFQVPFRHSHPSSQFRTRMFDLLKLIERQQRDDNAHALRQRRELIPRPRFR